MPRAQSQRRQPPAPDSTVPPKPPGNGHSEDDAPAEKKNVQIEVTAKGSGQDVRDELARMTAPAPEPEAVETEILPPEDDPLSLLLSDPKNMVIVTRQFPRIWNGTPCAFRVGGKYPCPITIAQIERDVFSRFGGKNYNVSIHPNTPNGEMRILEAFPIEHPTEEEPIFENEEQEVEVDQRGRPIFDSRRTIVMDGRDPTMMDDDSPTAVMRRALLAQIQIVTDKKQLAELKRQLKDLEDEDREEREEREERKRKKPEPAVADPRDREIAELRKRLDDSEKAKEGDRLTRIENQLAALAAGGGTKTDSSTMLLIEFMKSSDSKFNTMMGTITESIKGGRTEKQGMGELLDQLVKMKNVFGSDNTRVKDLEERLMDVAFENIAGARSSDDEEDTVKYTIKQAVPLFRTYLERSLEKEEKKGTPISPETQTRLMEETVRKVAADLAAKGVLVRNEKQPQGLPAPQPKPAVQPAMNPPAQQKSDPKKEGSDVKVPPGPQSPAYDRKKAVNFIVSVAISDIKRGCPDDTFLVGDIIDRLDHELLTQFAKIESGADLEAILVPHTDPALYEELKKAAGSSETSKTWMRKVLFTAQADIVRQFTVANETAKPT